MGQKSRVRRPPLDRTEPIRSWGPVIANAVGGGTPRETHGPEMHAANRVVEEYLRAGLDGAARFSRTPGSEQSRTSTERILQSTADLATSCFELLTRMAPMMSPFTMPFTGARPAEGGPPPGTTTARPEDSRQTSPSFGPAVTLAATGGRPLSISVAMQGGGTGTLNIQRLYPRTVDAAPLAGVSVSRHPSGHLLVRVDADPSAPADTYDGILLDAESGLPVGTLSVTLEGKPATTRTRRTRTATRDRQRRRR